MLWARLFCSSSPVKPPNSVCMVALLKNKARNVKAFLRANKKARSNETLVVRSEHLVCPHIVHNQCWFNVWKGCEMDSKCLARSLASYVFQKSPCKGTSTRIHAGPVQRGTSENVLQHISRVKATTVYQHDYHTTLLFPHSEFATQ